MIDFSEAFLVGYKLKLLSRNVHAHLFHNSCMTHSQMTKNAKKVCSYLIHTLCLLSENKSDIILIESFKPLDWLYILKIAFNYLLIIYFSLDQQVSPTKPHSLIKLITFVMNPTKPSSLIRLITLVISFCFNLVLICICSCENNPQ